MQPQDLVKSLNWRYATKVFDKNKKIPEEKLLALMESLRLSPSSLGAQPWKFLIIENKEIRKQIRENGFDQTQMTDASTLVVLCRREDVNESYVDEHVAESAKIRGVSAESLAGYKKMILNFLAGLTPLALEVWTSKQVYIALGYLLEAAAILEIDACPMEGFHFEKVDELLGLKEKNLRATVICALGYRDSADKNATLPKSRFPKEKIFEWYK